MYKKLFLGLAAIVGMTACSSDEPSNDSNVQLSGDEIALNIRLIDANSLNSRATDANPAFEYGTQAENEVNTVDFYFYNANGAYNQKVNKTITWTTGTDNNVEKIGQAIVVLKNLPNTNAPSYVVAVLNGGTLDLAGKSLAEAKAQLVVNSYKAGDYFTMTNSTYNNDNAASEYFATPILASNFIEQVGSENQWDATAAPVDIYVERLASKVSVDVDNSLKSGDKVNIGTYEVNGVQEPIYMQILGWGLNGTAKNMYAIKHVPAWNYDLTGANWTTASSWSDPTNKRCYWAQSTNYGDANATYPTSAEGFQGNGTLAYTNWNTLSATLGGDGYCMENTNTQAILQANNVFYSKVTSALLKAQIVDNDGNPLTLLRYTNSLYTQDGFIASVLNSLKGYALSYTESNGTYTYHTISAEDIEMVNNYNGVIKIQLSNTGKAKMWTKAQATAGQAPTVYPVATLAQDIANLGITADCYNNGMMYYNIPIEHLRGGKVNFDTKPYSVQEADYGIVRNHLYKLTINKVENLGNAVYDPEETIIPGTQPNRYFVGSRINILAWKIVNQSVDL